MAVYSVHSEFPQPALKTAIEREFPISHFHYSGTLAFVRSDETAKQISIKLGIKTRSSEGETSGILDGAFVMQATPFYFGFTKASLWEWLKNAMEADG